MIVIKTYPEPWDTENEVRCGVHNGAVITSAVSTGVVFVVEYKDGSRGVWQADSLSTAIKEYFCDKLVPTASVIAAYDIKTGYRFAIDMMEPPSLTVSFEQILCQMAYRKVTLGEDGSQGFATIKMVPNQDKIVAILDNLSNASVSIVFLGDASGSQIDLAKKSECSIPKNKEGLEILCDLCEGEFRISSADPQETN